MLRTVMAVLLGLTLTAAAWAQESGGEHARYAEGTHYKVLVNPGNVDEPGQVEVREFFSYICPHCFSLEPVIEDWLEDKPEHVNYVRSPVTFLQNAEPLARAYYVADILDKVDEIHKPLFDAIHKHREPLFTPTALADFFAKYGVEEDEFNQLYSSFGVSTKLRQTDALARDYQIRGVPSFVVNGKYLILRDGLRNNQEMFDVIDFLVKKERR